MSRRPPRHLARLAEVPLTNASSLSIRIQVAEAFRCGLCAGAHSKHTCGKALPVRPKGAAAKRKAEKEKRPKQKREKGAAAAAAPDASSPTRVTFSPPQVCATAVHFALFGG